MVAENLVYLKNYPWKFEVDQMTGKAPRFGLSPPPHQKLAKNTVFEFTLRIKVRSFLRLKLFMISISKQTYVKIWVADDIIE